MTHRSLTHWLFLTTVAGVACTLDLSGCGGSSPSTSSEDAGDASDARSDAIGDDGETIEDAEVGDVGSTPMNDGGADGTSSTSDGGPDATTEADGSSDGASGANDATTGSDSSPMDASGDSAATGGDAGDAATSACPDSTACSNNGMNGVCSGGACVACDSGGTSTGPDTTCTTAYGGGTTPYVCSSGSCLPGNCNTNTDCSAATPTCGFSTPNVCGGCTADSQCASGQICDTKTSDTNIGKCVSASAGCPSGATAVTCGLNADDQCCAGSCVAGNCCVGGGTCGASTTCKAETPGAVGGICTTCAAVTGTNPVYFVDPVNGDDTNGTGNNSAANACAFRTITRALEVIGTAATGTSIDVVNKAGSGTVTVQGVTGTPSAGQEKFPIVIPSNVTLVTSGGAVTIEVPAAAAHTATQGLILAGNPSAIAGGAGATLTIDGQTKTATSGILVESPAATLSALNVKNFAQDGIVVNDFKGVASALTVDAGVDSNGNGVDGLAILGSSTASITGSGAAPTTFDNNGAHGIYVRGTASVQATGSIGANPPSTSTVVMSGNTQAGIWIEQTVNTTAKNTLTGVVCTASTSGNGLRIVPGSNVNVRSSWFLGNSSGNGIAIQGPAGTTGSSIANIDLGTMASPGNNVLQAPSGGPVNGNAGICLMIATSANAQLPAQGNVFGGTSANEVNCATTAGALRVGSGLGCGNHVDVGGNIVAFPTDATTGNTINVTQCTY